MSLSNTSPLVAAYIAAKAAEEAAAAAVKAARDAIVATGLDLIAGEHADVVVSLSERVAVDTAACKKLLGDATPTKTSDVTTLRIKVKVAA
jgi:hypothetical protein